MSKLMVVVLLPCLLMNEAYALFSPYEYLNYLQDAQTALNTARQVESELKMLQYQVQNSGRVSDYQWRNTMQLMQQLDQVSQQGQALSYSASQLDNQFRQKYPNYNQAPYGKTNYQEAYTHWNASTLDTIQNSMQSTGMMANNLQNEQQYLAQLQRQGQTAQGRMQALQVSTELSAEQVNQMQALKRIMMTQANSQNAYLAYRVSKDSYSEASLEKINQKLKTGFPKYHNNPQLGEIKQ